jgi:hypothetical protein
MIHIAEHTMRDSMQYCSMLGKVDTNQIINQTLMKESWEGGCEVWQLQS